MPNQFPMFSKENYNLDARTKYLDAQRAKELDAELLRIRETANAEKQRQIDVQRDALQNAKNLLAEREKLQKDEEDRKRNEAKTGLEQVIVGEMRKSWQGPGWRFPGINAIAKEHSEHAMQRAEAAPALQQLNETDKQLGTQKYAKDIAEALSQMGLAQADANKERAITDTEKSKTTRDAAVENELTKLLGGTAINKEIAANPKRFADPRITAAEIRAEDGGGNTAALDALFPKSNTSGQPATQNAPPARINLKALSTGASPSDPNKATLPLPPSATGPADSDGRRTSALGGGNEEVMKVLKQLLEKLFSQSNTLSSIPGIAR